MIGLSNPHLNRVYESLKIIEELADIQTSAAERERRSQEIIKALTELLVWAVQTDQDIKNKLPISIGLGI